MTTTYLPTSYATWTVWTSYGIATLASYLALHLSRRERNRTDPYSRLWWAAGSVALGTGIWSMHFVGMLAFSVPIKLGYAPLPTLLSWLAGVVAAGVALWIATGGPMHLRQLLNGSLCMAAGICAMHYLGMHAIELTPAIEWNHGLVALSAVIAFAASAAALTLFSAVKRMRRYRLLGEAGAASAMGLAICGMHYVGMAAARIPLGAVCTSADKIGTQGLESLVIAATLVVLTAALLMNGYAVLRTLAAALQSANDQLVKANADLAELAYCDPLTRLPNRVVLEQGLRTAAQQIDRARVGQVTQSLAVLFIDLDGFKPINDAYGHAAGDEVLVQIAQRLRALTRGGDLVARLGGDEFVIVACMLNGRDDAEQLAERVLLSVSQPMTYSTSHVVAVTASVGIAMYPGAVDLDKLIGCADKAMYDAKRAGRNRVSQIDVEPSAPAAPGARAAAG
jgi:diguanylate cyclase (GGDEF)-like protein